MTVKDLEKKIIRVLFNFIYFYIHDKKKLINKVRLWKSLYGDECGDDPDEMIVKLEEVDSKYTNYTHAKINA